jgi:uncharacterized membrane protein YgdD (TMEM256/DUF423 family)
MAASRLWIFIGALSGALSVITGAFGAHALRERVTMRALEVYQTGCQYQLTHALALVALGIWIRQLTLVTQTNSTASLSLANWAGWAFTIGTVLFSGSLYALALTDVKILGAITPFGGLSFIFGWIMIAVSAWKMTA